ncbi:protein SIX6OS1 [Anarrhichthys ocellatus]|uniref:protein SIX6OS1 n=1 Tax=Anarrhichthys ocellatus TaxID=433405 RepID=UPI0012EE1751|nr:protein SIX6OS1-like [Anarrhichthys ocellatus]
MKATNGLLLQYEHTLKAELESRKASYHQDIVSGQQPVAEPEEQSDPQTEEESHASIDISSLHLNQTKNGNKTSVEANAEEIHEENKVQYTSVCSPSSGGENSELWSGQPLDEQRHPDELHPDEQEQETEQEDQVLQSTVSAVAVDEDVAMDEEQTPSEEDNEGLAAFAQSSSRDKHPQSTPLEMTAVPSTLTFPFNFSPARSPRHGTSDTKSPAFLFSLNSEPSTPGFSGFGFEAGSSQDEESPFAFAGSFFNEKKTTEPKSSTCPEFLFGQPEQSEVFQFAFSSKSPQTSNKDNTGDDFPFSFNF